MSFADKLRNISNEIESLNEDDKLATLFFNQFVKYSENEMIKWAERGLNYCILLEYKYMYFYKDTNRFQISHRYSSEQSNLKINIYDIINKNKFKTLMNDYLNSLGSSLTYEFKNNSLYIYW